MNREEILQRQIEVLESRIAGLNENQNGLRNRLREANEEIQHWERLGAKHGIALCHECDGEGCGCCQDGDA